MVIGIIFDGLYTVHHVDFPLHCSICDKSQVLWFQKNRHLPLKNPGASPLIMINTEIMHSI